MEASSLTCTFHYLCPREKNHKFETKERLIKHLSNCKLLKADIDFFSCKYDIYHLFVSVRDKEEHEKKCPSWRKLVDTRENQTAHTQFFKISNPGYDPSFVPKKVMTGYYTQNRERLEREELMIKTNKSKVRVNVADMKKDHADGDFITLYGRDKDGFLRMLLEPNESELLASIDADFSPTNILSLQPQEDFWLEKQCNDQSSQLATSSLVGYITFPISSVASGSLVDRLRNEICEGQRFLSFKDNKENQYVIVGEEIRQLAMERLKNLGSEISSSGGYRESRFDPQGSKGEPRAEGYKFDIKNQDETGGCGSKPLVVGDKRHSGEIVGKGKMALIYLLKSDYYKKVADKSLEMRREKEKSDLKESESRRVQDKLKELKAEESNLVFKCQALGRTRDGLQGELKALSIKMLQEEDSSTQINYLRTNQEIGNLKNTIMEKQSNFTEELKMIKDQKLADYMRMLIDDLTKLNDKIIHHKNNIMAYQENIGKVEAYNQDTKKMIDSYKTTTDDYTKQAEVCNDLLSKEKDVTQTTTKDQKKGVIIKKEMSCHLCKSSYVSMVTKPCNHCILCWSCFHAFVQNGLKNCLICEENVEYCFKVNYI